MYSAQRKTNLYVHRVKNNQMHSIQLNGRKFVPRESGNHMYLVVRTTSDPQGTGSQMSLSILSRYYLCVYLGMDNQMHLSVRTTIQTQGYENQVYSYVRKTVYNQGYGKQMFSSLRTSIYTQGCGNQMYSPICIHLQGQLFNSWIQKP